MGEYMGINKSFVRFLGCKDRAVVATRHPVAHESTEMPRGSHVVSHQLYTFKKKQKIVAYARINRESIVLKNKKNGKTLTCKTTKYKKRSSTFSLKYCQNKKKKKKKKK